MTDEVLVDRMPERFNLGQSYQAILLAVFEQREWTRLEPEYHNPLNLRTVMGFVVPEFQRPLVWTHEQKVRFLESVWLGMPIGTYTINTDGPRMDTAPELRNIIVDGQQRMSALEDYVNDVFPVFGLLFSELNRIERRRLSMIHFTRFETYSSDEAYIRDYYNRMNLGGTPHTEDQRA